MSRRRKTVKVCKDWDWEWGDWGWQSGDDGWKREWWRGKRGERRRGERKGGGRGRTIGGGKKKRRRRKKSELLIVRPRQFERWGDSPLLARPYGLSPGRTSQLHQGLSSGWHLDTGILLTNSCSFHLLLNCLPPASLHATLVSAWVGLIDLLSADQDLCGWQSPTKRESGVGGGSFFFFHRQTTSANFFVDVVNFWSWDSFTRCPMHLYSKHTHTQTQTDTPSWVMLSVWCVWHHSTERCCGVCCQVLVFSTWI